VKSHESSARASSWEAGVAVAYPLVLPKQRCIRIGAGVTLAGLLAVGGARAENAGSAPVDVSTPPPATTPSGADAVGVARDSTHARAAELYREADALYASGDTARALDAMQRSFELSGYPELLFNIGQMQRELHDCPAALKSYEAYLARATHGTHRDEVGRSVETLRAQCPEPSVPPPAATAVAVSPTPPAPVPVAPDRPGDGYWTPLRIAGWSTLGAAAVTAAGALYATARAQTYEGRDEDRITNDKASGLGYQPSDKTIEEDGERAASWARALGITAAGLTAIGVSLIVISPEKQQPTKAAISMGVGPGRAWVSGAF